ncbi:MAG: hypothetical protein WC227_04310 [Patescibacteria group bacterium]|jgi:hypothetical protein
MKKYITTLGPFLKEFLVDDIVNRYLFSISLIWSFVDYLIWHFLLSSPDIFVYIRIGVYPIKLLFIILILNTVLAFSSFKREREIGYLLFIGNILAVALVMILEIYYLSHQ